MTHTGVIFKNLNYFTTSSNPPIDEKYAYLLAIYLEKDETLPTSTLYSTEYFGSGSHLKIRSIAELGCSPISYADENCPTIEIPLSQSQYLISASRVGDTETILDWLEDNYFYHNGEVSTGSVHSLNDINHWLTSGTFCNVVTEQVITTLGQQFPTGSI